MVDRAARRARQELERQTWENFPDWLFRFYSNCWLSLGPHKNESSSSFNQLSLPIPPNPPRRRKQARFPFAAKYFSGPPSPAGEGEPGPPGLAARSAGEVREAPREGPAPKGRGGAQLDLPVRARSTLPPPEALACAFCDRRGTMRVAGEVRCSWHVTATLPAAVRREVVRRG